MNGVNSFIASNDAAQARQHKINDSFVMQFKESKHRLLLLNNHLARQHPPLITEQAIPAFGDWPAEFLHKRTSTAVEHDQAGHTKCINRRDSMLHSFSCA